MNLFLDTTNNLTLGISKHGKTWAYFKHYAVEKSSEIIHSEIYYNLKRFGLKVKDLEGVFVCLGPGSYTGIRLGLILRELYCEIGPPTWGYHTHKVPEGILGGEGAYSCPAYKEEMFLYRWGQGSGEGVLTRDFSPVEKNLFTHSDVLDLIKNHPEEFFHFVKEGQGGISPFYFRPVEKEFRAFYA